MTETLTNLLVNGITSHSSMLDSFVILNAALISALHKIVGIEFGWFCFTVYVDCTLTGDYSGFRHSDHCCEVRRALLCLVCVRAGYNHA